MDFALSKRQLELQDQAREAVARTIAPIDESVSPGGKLSAEQWRMIYSALRPLGYLGSTIPKDLGGAGLSYVDYGVLLEALAEGPLVLGEIVPPRTINYLGTDEQKRRWLPKLFSGDWISTAAITEPQAGSDLRGLKTTAAEAAGGFRVNGVKKWIKLGGVSDLITLLVVTGRDEDGKPKTSRLVLERDHSPWQSRELETLGIEKISFAELRFRDVEVPKENLLGTPGQGAEQFNRGIEASRAFVGLQAAGIARRALKRAVAYAKERYAFGRPLAKFQAIQTSLADAATKLDAARLLCLRALAILDGGQRCPAEVSMAKLFATETAVEVCHAAMDSMGAYGLSREAGVERCWRDCRMLTVIDGASGIQRLIIGRELFGMPAFT
ncbi:MAG TPA: acyl-CoA dehydrogenase family protein [Alphaproteobacteria bacterium]|nr:acyl-CoA dehydrogenase family protein [Alphaproteobacteria bacterium]